ncbi:MAG: fatty acid desaturase family protein [Stappiaceae bacterium]
MSSRDYRLDGEDGRQAIERGLAAAKWYHTDVPRTELRALMERKDGPAIRDTIIWFGLLIVSGGVGVLLWPSWLSVPFWLVYGVLYGSAGDSRWHECGHGTAFKTKWMNRAVYQVACFFMIRNPISWRWSHSRHHADTIIVGRDPEIVAMRPPDLMRMGLNFLGILDALDGLRAMLINATGRPTREQALYVPDAERTKMVFVARIWCAIYAITIGSALTLQSIVPLMLIGLPRLYGAWHHVLTGILQHSGLAENVLDYRLNTRTVLMNPFSRFIYWNMNYHVEHHMFPMVPYYALPRLHALIKHDLPAANPGIIDAYREVLPILLKQLNREDYFLERGLPDGAKPYRHRFHESAELR